MTLLAALMGSMTGATAGAAVVKWAFPTTSYWSAWETWLIGDIIGVLVFAPLVFSWTAECATFFCVHRSSRIVECAALFLGLIIVAQGVYGEILPRPLMVPIMILPFLIWAAIRFGPAGASAAVLVAGFIGVWNTSHGLGPYTLHANAKSANVAIQGTLGVASLSVLLLAAAVAERKLAEQQKSTHQRVGESPQRDKNIAWLDSTVRLVQKDT